MSEILDTSPLARVNGEPFTDLPQDLYIPPDALAVYLHAFEGPLDLLLYLIRRHNLDVLDIPMADITRQYMDYVELMRSNRLDLAAEYLLMAALLIEIKSRMLLPRQSQADESGEVEDPRAELVRRLLEYEQMKIAGQTVENTPREGRDFEVIAVWSEESGKLLPHVEPGDLRAAWLGLVARAGAHRHHTVGRQELSVREAMGQILDALQTGDFIEFSCLFDPSKGIPHLVVTFLAILELARELMIEITQSEAFSPIYIRLSHADQ
ncbi:MAG: segregation and condensation protein A [Sulfuriferula sp.]